MMESSYDVIIVGAGPAGILAALELSRETPLKILIIEKGRDLEKRHCPAQENNVTCQQCWSCSMTTGWGGSGAYSDGKLTLTTEFGGYLKEYMEAPYLKELIDYVDALFLQYGASEKLFGVSEEAVKDIHRQAVQSGLTFVPALIRHLGTENCWEILKRLRRDLEQKVEISLEHQVESLIVEDRIVKGVETESGRRLRAEYVIMGPGRQGAEWLFHEADRLGLKGSNNPVDIGVRVEVPAVIMEHLTEKVYESKFVYFSKSFDDKVRTFCMNPQGQVVLENYDGLVSVNGHSYAELRTKNTNFALLVSKTFTQPFNEPIRYGRYIATLANMLSGGVIVQRLGDLRVGRRSTDERIQRGMVQPSLNKAVPGDLSLVLPYRHLHSILEMLRALDSVAPGVNSRQTLLYGVEVKFYSFRLELSSSLETGVSNLFAVGDGSGVTRGLIQAAVSGVVAAREILRRTS